MATPGAGLLGTLVAEARAACARRRATTPPAAVRAAAAAAPPPRGLTDALRRPAGGPVRLLAELKRASPVAGPLARGFDPVACAPEYVAAGAAALSVLTDAHFQGELRDLRAVRARVGCPLLQKDFLVDEYQLWEARAAGADGVLLIVRALEPAALRDLHQAARGLGLDVLLEVHDEAELERAAALGVELLGINNRDLTTFRTDLATTERLAPLVPAGACVVSESGIASAADVARVGHAGVDAVLVGEALSRSGDPAAKIRELLGSAAPGVS